MTQNNKRYKIIIVENDEDEREFMLQGFKESNKFEILAMLKNGDLLLDWLGKNEQKPDLILSDLNMPGKNGYDIILHMKSWQIPVVITSTSTTRSIIERCLDSGAADYIVKPDTFVEYEDFAKRFHQTILEKKLV